MEVVFGGAIIASNDVFEKVVYSLLGLGVDWGVWGRIGASSVWGRPVVAPGVACVDIRGYQELL